MKLQMGLDFKFDFSNKGIFASYMRYSRKKGKVVSLNKPNIESQYSIVYSSHVDDIVECSKNQAEWGQSLCFGTKIRNSKG